MSRRFVSELGMEPEAVSVHSVFPAFLSSNFSEEIFNFLLKRVGPQAEFG